MQKHDLDPQEGRPPAQQQDANKKRKRADEGTVAANGNANKNQRAFNTAPTAKRLKGAPLKDRLPVKAKELTPDKGVAVPKKSKEIVKAKVKEPVNRFRRADPEDEEMAYLEAKLGIRSGKGSKRLQSELGLDGLDGNSTIHTIWLHGVLRVNE